MHRHPALLATTIAVTAALVAWATYAVERDLAAAGPAPAPAPALRTVMFVGNNWAGTATIVDAHTHQRIRTIDIVPDKKQELADIHAAPDRLAFYLAVQQGIGEGHDQYVDDMYTTNDGRFLAVSRPSFADVVWIDLARAASGKPKAIVAEGQMDGYRTDHMAVSPDGRRLLVSDSTARQVIEFSMVDETLRSGREIRMGQRLRTFPTGDTPHESNYLADGRRILHASIGRVYTPGDYGYLGPVDASTVHDAVKADRWLQVVRDRDFDVVQRWDMGKELDEAGYPGYSSAVRPMAITPGEDVIYLQVSFLHGFVEFDLSEPDPTGGGDYTLEGEREPRLGTVTRVVHLPVSQQVQDMPREQYVLDSAHHGLAINRAGTKLCVAGTMSDYAAIVDRSTFRAKVFKGRARFLDGRRYSKPYWSTRGPDNTCWVSMSGSDLVTIIDFHTERVVAEVPVGEHPQRVRQGVVRASILDSWG